MKQSIYILHLEDDPADAELVQARLEEAGLTCQITHVQTRDEYGEALRRGEYDIILADYQLPMFDGISALRLAQELCPDVPFIFVSGTMGEDAAIEGLTEGATDYVLKQKLLRLAPAIIRALHEAENRRERKRAEEALRQRTRDMERLTTAIEQVAETVVVTDIEGNIVYVNPAFERITGYSCAEVIGQNPRILKSGRQNLAFYQELWSTICAGQAWSGHIINKKKDGTLYTEEVTISPVKDENSAIVNYMAVKRDVTHELQLEEQYYQAQKMQALGQLTAGVAHDFNNLLTAINGFTELAQYELAADHPLQDSLGMILYAGQRAAKLIGQLMAFSRKQVMEPQVLNLNVVVAEMDKMLQRILGEHIILKTKLASDLELVKADPIQLEQVIVNLAVNARDAMPHGGYLTVETVNITLDQSYAANHLEVIPGEYILLTISDNGVGMSEEVKAHIFEPFFTTKEMGKGTGLGLATVFGIVKQSGGHITVYSEPGLGTTFKTYLPAVQSPAASLLAPQTQPVAHYGTGIILLVEDDEPVRSLTRYALQAQGYTILETCSGSEALSLARQQQREIDLLLTDVVMPQMSGRQLAEQIKALYPRIKVLFMSGYTNDTVVQHGLLTAEIEFLPKPFSLNTLVSKVREVLNA
ncbi:MAG: response regulator [Anaerolineae bacterium]|nr:response regulator [Anaerolineae bacterium]